MNTIRIGNSTTTQWIAALLFPIVSVGCSGSGPEDDEWLEIHRDFAKGEGYILWLENFRGATLFAIETSELDGARLPTAFKRKFVPTIGDEIAWSFEPVTTAESAELLKLLENRFASLPKLVQRAFETSSCQVFRVRVGTERYLCINGFPTEEEAGRPGSIYRNIVSHSGGGSRFFRICFNEQTENMIVTTNHRK